MNTPVIKTDNLTKYYGKKRGIDGVNLTIFKGEIFGYLGPNAAGKTTTIRVFMDFIRANSGNVNIFGLDSRKNSRKIRKKTGYLPGELNLYENLSVKEFLVYFAHLRENIDWTYVEYLAERLNCDLFHPIRTLSQGNKQKVGLIQALMHQPDLLILDEPTNGLDPLIRQHFYQLILEFKEKGKTIFLSSHVLPEVERICDRVGIIRGGKIVAVEKVSELRKKSMRQIEVLFDQPIKLEMFSGIKNITNLTVDKHRLKCILVGEMNQFVKVISRYNIIDFSSHQPGLDEIFLAFYGESNNA